MFGKLFGYLSLVRSGLLQDHKELSIEILARLLELHKRRNWLKEVVSEAIFVVMWALPVAVVADEVLPLLGNTDTDGTIGLGSFGTGTNLALPSTPLEQYEPWQLLLGLGLQRYASQYGDNKKIKKQVQSLMPDGLKKICTIDTFPRLQNTLLAATSGFLRSTEFGIIYSGRFMAWKAMIDFYPANAWISSAANKRLYCRHLYHS